MFLSSENKEILIKRAKSFLWRLGGYCVVAALNWLAMNLELFNLPPAVVSIVALVIGELTKLIFVNLPELKTNKMLDG